MMEQITVICVDDHLLIRQAVRSLLAERDDIVLVGEGGNGDAVLSLMAEHNPDILILDLSMPQSDDPDNDDNFRAMPVIEEVRRQWPDTGIIILTGSNVPAFLQAFVDRGVAGYILKSDDLSMDLVIAIQSISRGGVFFSESITQMFLRRDKENDSIKLTLRQVEMLTYIFRYPNSSNDARAAAFGIAKGTVRAHLTEAYKALGVNNVTAAILRCLELGIFNK